MTDLKIQLKAVEKAFGKNHVLNGVDLDVPKGASTVIIGGSGSGKSVMLKCILGLIHPDRGSILVDGREVTHLGAKDRDETLRKFGMLFQSAALFDPCPSGKCCIRPYSRAPHGPQRCLQHSC